MTTYTKEIIQKNQEHILDYMELEDFIYTVSELEAITPYNAILKMVRGGYFLVYHGDVNTYLDETIGKPKKRYSDTESWELYCRLIARDGSKLYNKISKEKELF